MATALLESFQVVAENLQVRLLDSPAPVRRSQMVMLAGMGAGGVGVGAAVSEPAGAGSEVVELPPVQLDANTRTATDVAAIWGRIMAISLATGRGSGRPRVGRRCYGVDRGSPTGRNSGCVPTTSVPSMKFESLDRDRNASLRSPNGSDASLWTSV